MRGQAERAADLRPARARGQHGSDDDEGPKVSHQRQVRSSGQTIRSTRVNAPRCSRSGVSHAVCRHGSSARRAWPRAPRPERARGGRSCPRPAGPGRSVTRPSPASRMRCSTSRARRRARCCAGRSGCPRPTSSSESASLTSLSRFVRCSRATSADAPRWSGVFVYGRSSAPVATSHTSHAGSGSVARLRASATSVPTPDALSSRPGGRAGRCRCAPSRSPGSPRPRP